MLVGGADSLCGLTLNGFDSLESLSGTLCQPFDNGRQGINIGEGAALFLLSRQPAPLALLGAGSRPMPGTSRRRIQTAWGPRRPWAWRWPRQA